MLERDTHWDTLQDTHRDTHRDTLLSPRTHTMKVTLCLGLLLALAVTACQCRPAAEAPGTVGDPQQHPPSLVRRDLSPEQQHLLSQFLPHILAELNNHKAFVHEDEGMEALHDHYYPDWMDFGRRSAEDEAGAA